MFSLECQNIFLYSSLEKVGGMKDIAYVGQSSEVSTVNNNDVVEGTHFKIPV